MSGEYGYPLSGQVVFLKNEYTGMGMSYHQIGYPIIIIGIIIHIIYMRHQLWRTFVLVLASGGGFRGGGYCPASPTVGRFYCFFFFEIFRRTCIAGIDRGMAAYVTPSTSYGT